MSLKDRLAAAIMAARISWFDLAVLGLFVVGGLAYHTDPKSWGIGYVGDAEYGDGQFWWDGAIHVSEGFFRNNPGKGYRPGYFVLTGLTLPVLGTDFVHYYSYFRVAFLAACGFFYLALRTPIGRWTAMCGVGMLVFNPITAEWLATSTTDATGLLLHLLALSCLLVGLARCLDRTWLAAFGACFALGTLTRPIVTPFIGAAILVLLLLSHYGQTNISRWRHGLLLFRMLLVAVLKLKLV
jgi:hypothetical protein